MTREQLIDLRKRLELTQTGLAQMMGMSLRAFQVLENEDGKIRPVHHLALERISLREAAARRDPSKCAAGVLQDARRVCGIGAFQPEDATPSWPACTRSA